MAVFSGGGRRRPSFRRMLSQIRENQTRFFSLPWTTPLLLPAASPPLFPSLKRTRRVDFFLDDDDDLSFLLLVCWVVVLRPHLHSRRPPPMVWGEGVGVGVVSAAFEDRRQSYNGDIVVIAISLSPKEKQRLSGGSAVFSKAFV